jgi:hypothetical protein
VSNHPTITLLRRTSSDVLDDTRQWIGAGGGERREKARERMAAPNILDTPKLKGSVLLGGVASVGPIAITFLCVYS